MILRPPSICRRTGAAVVVLLAVPGPGAGPTVTYRWGDKSLDLHHSATCGCITHWSPLDPALDRMGVNARLMEPAIVAAARVRRFYAPIRGRFSTSAVASVVQWAALELVGHADGRAPDPHAYDRSIANASGP